MYPMVYFHEYPFTRLQLASATEGTLCLLLVLYNEGLLYLVLISQETRYVSATEPNRLMLFREEKIAVYCENLTEHTNALYTCNAEV
jgi:hypothetical protein